jgi:hypothetical protein
VAFILRELSLLKTGCERTLQTIGRSEEESDED